MRVANVSIFAHYGTHLCVDATVLRCNAHLPDGTGWVLVSAAAQGACDAPGCDVHPLLCGCTACASEPPTSLTKAPNHV